MSHWCSEEPEALAVWVRLLMEANHSSIKKLFNGVLVEINRGQTVFGLEAFSKKSGVSIAKLRRYLDLFEKEGMIDRQKTSKYSLITITCYDKYQSEAGKEQADHNQIASKSQHYKNDKECEEETHAQKTPSKAIPYQKIAEMFNEYIGDDFPKIRGINTDKRKRITKKFYIYMERDLDKIAAYFGYFGSHAGDFYRGKQEGSSWIANFDYIVKDETVEKCREGNL
jgi:hypothetical protein